MNHSDYTSEIAKLRSKIENIDRRIVKWIALRVHIAKKIGDLKKTHGIEVIDTSREEKVFNSVNSLAEQAGLDTSVMHRIFRDLIDESRFVQLYSNYPEKYSVPQITAFDKQLIIPPSKSITNRALILSSLGEGIGYINNFLVCEDTQLMIEALKDLGVSIRIKENVIKVYGNEGCFKSPNNRIYAGGAGTVMRFLTALGSLIPGGVIIEGNERMHQRPIGNLLEALESQGLKAFSLYENNCPPVFIHGRLAGGIIRLKADFSSQYLSGLLMVSPYALSPVTIIIDGKIVSASYVDLTISMMEEFGVKVVRKSQNEFFVMNNQKYKNRDYSVERDFASASYFIGMAAILQSRLVLPKMNQRSIQGEKGFIDLLQKMGAKINWRGSSFIYEGGELCGIDADMNLMPDSVMTLAVIGAFAKGVTRIRNVKNLRIKESDRIQAIFNELNKAGIKTEQLDDGLIVYGGDPKPCELETYNDHRIAMSLSLLGIKKPGFILKNPVCVAKTFPEFFKMLESLSE